jgi:hypothetical protein
MTAALLLALFFTVALLATTAYFLMGSVPLLILKHDTPMDSRFVRGFYDTYCRVATFTASAAALSYGLAGRPFLAAGAGALAVSVIVLRRVLIPKMDSLRAQLQSSETRAIRGFRRIHLTAILANLLQLVVTVWSLIAVSIQMK